MRTRRIKIGNSHGVRIPKRLLEQSRLGEEVEIQAHPQEIVIRAATHPRQGWDELFRAMAARGDDRMLDDVVATTERDEWEW